MWTRWSEVCVVGGLTLTAGAVFNSAEISCFTLSFSHCSSPLPHAVLLSSSRRQYESTAGSASVVFLLLVSNVHHHSLFKTPPPSLLLLLLLCVYN